MLLVDTCQAASMMHQLGAAPPVVSLASSRTGQNSYSYVTDHALGVALSDRFTFHLHRFVMWHHQHKGRAAPPTVGDAVGALSPRLLNSHVQLGAHGAGRTVADAAALPLLRYFAQPAPPLATVAPLAAAAEPAEEDESGEEPEL